MPGDWKASSLDQAHRLLRTIGRLQGQEGDAEFVSKIELCTQEADETILWLELLRDDCGITSERIEWLLDESNQLISIFVTILKNVKKKRKQ
ncbi:four helix bundle protein [Desulfobacterium sp. N47]|uniref:four helix bundle protein n=1 Tax=Desulfobacterium sp. N47 TaxID=3115210 RepID=UPI003F49C5F1